jgi:hypothetical protein
MAEEKKKIHYELIKSISTLMTAAFGLVAALSWNTAITAIFVTIFGVQNALLPQVLYAVLVTIIAVVVTMYMSRLMSRIEPK